MQLLSGTRRELLSTKTKRNATYILTDSAKGIKNKQCLIGMGVNMEIKIRKDFFVFLLLCSGLILFPYIFRTKLSSSSLAYINSISYIALFVFIRGKIQLVKSKGTSYILLICIILFGLIDVLVKDVHGRQALFEITYHVMPFILFFAKPCSKRLDKVACMDSTQRIFGIWNNMLSLAVMFIFVTAVLDLITERQASAFWANYYDVLSLHQMVGEGRIVSFYGHSLTCKSIVMINYIFKHIGYEVFDEKEHRWLWTVVSAICIAMTGSKSGIALFMVAILLFNKGNKRLRNIMAIGILGYICYLLGLFDTVIERFTTSTTLSTGRWDAIVEFLTIRKYSFHLFYGTSNASMDLTTQAFKEVAVFAWMYKNGIINAILKVFVLFIGPLITVIRSKNKTLIISAVLIILEANTSDYIVSVGDGTFLYCMVIWMLYAANEFYFLQRWSKGEK